MVSQGINKKEGALARLEQGNLDLKILWKHKRLVSTSFTSERIRRARIISIKGEEYLFEWLCLSSTSVYSATRQKAVPTAQFSSTTSLGAHVQKPFPSESA